MKKVKRLPDKKFRVKRVKNRTTNTYLSLYDRSELPGYRNRGRWAIYCERHASVRYFHSYREAIGIFSKPDRWCAGCSLIYQKKEKFIATLAKRSSVYSDKNNPPDHS